MQCNSKLYKLKMWLSYDVIEMMKLILEQVTPATQLSSGGSCVVVSSAASSDLVRGDSEATVLFWLFDWQVRNNQSLWRIRRQLVWFLGRFCASYSLVRSSFVWIFVPVQSPHIQLVVGNFFFFLCVVAAGSRVRQQCCGMVGCCRYLPSGSDYF